MNTPFILFLDDLREFGQISYPPEIQEMNLEVKTARNYDEFVNIITKFGLPRVVSADHDLAVEHLREFDRAMKHNSRIRYEIFKDKTGLDCAKYLVNYCQINNLPLPIYFCHSQNYIGRRNIMKVLDDYQDGKKTI